MDLYMSYGSSLDIFPDEKAKEALFKKINILKSKIEKIK